MSIMAKTWMGAARYLQEVFVTAGPDSDSEALFDFDRCLTLKPQTSNSSTPKPEH